MTIQKIRTTGYVCSPYLHDHNSIEQKDLWMASKNIGDMYFVTATFSENSQPYFSYATNHYILAQFKNHQKHLLQQYVPLLHRVFQVCLYHIQIFYKVRRLVDHQQVVKCKNQIFNEPKSEGLLITK